MCSDRILWLPGPKIKYRSVFSHNRLDRGRCSPVSWFQNFLLTYSYSLKIAGVFTRYRVDSKCTYFSISSIPGCVLLLSYLSFWRFYMCSPVSIASGKKHLKSPAHFSVFRRFCKMCLSDFQDWLYYHLPPPPPVFKGLSIATTHTPPSLVILQYL